MEGIFYFTMKHIIDEEWKGRLLVGSRTYDHKPPKSEGGRISNEINQRVYVTNKKFSEMISNGRPYCPTERQKENVGLCEFICIDIDYSTEPMLEFIKRIKYIPTIYYESSSNNSDVSRGLSFKKFKDEEHKYRFRMIYALKTPTHSCGEYNAAFNYIIAINEIDKRIVDGREANQYYFGNYNTKVYNTNFIYYLPDNYKDYFEEKIETQKSARSKTNTIQPYHLGLDLALFSEDVISQFFKIKRYEDFLIWYEEEYGRPCVLTESIYVQSEEDERKLVLEDKYYCIERKYVRYDKELGGKIYGKWVDGEMRHKKIFETGLILRRLNEGITHDEMLYAIVNILLRYYELKDSDGSLKFGKKAIRELVMNIMKAPLLEMREVRHRQFLVSDSYCRKNRVSKNQVKGMILGDKNREKKEENYDEIDFFYDPALTWENGKKITQNQWLKILEENGLKMCLRTFKSYLEDRGYTKKREPKKSAKCKTNIIQPYHLDLDLALSSEEDDCPVYDDSCVASNRKFIEIVGKIQGSDGFRSRWRA